MDFGTNREISLCYRAGFFWLYSTSVVKIEVRIEKLSSVVARYFAWCISKVGRLGGSGLEGYQLAIRAKTGKNSCLP